ncbi:MAG: hypothetical protein ACI4Q6_05140 [Huintestinicola sp.]
MSKKEKRRIKKVEKMLLDQMKAVKEQSKIHANLYVESAHAMAELAEVYAKLTSSGS